MQKVNKKLGTNDSIKGAKNRQKIQCLKKQGLSQKHKEIFLKP